MNEAESPPVLTERAARALGSTQKWAGFAGFALFSVALLTLVRSGVVVWRLGGAYRAGMLTHTVVVATTAGAVVGALWVLGVNAALGWLALRYAGVLERMRLVASPDPSDVTRALRVQHRFWRLQGVLLIVSLVLLALGVAAIIVSAVLAHR